MIKLLLALAVFVIIFMIYISSTKTAQTAPKDPTTEFNREKGSNEWVDPTGNYKG